MDSNDLIRIKSYLKQILSHSDELYNLVPKAEGVSYNDEANKPKRMAGWHGHEINKYISLIRDIVHREEKQNVADV